MSEAWQPLGKHLCQILDDIVSVETHGELIPAEALQLMELLVQVEAARGWVGVLCDVGNGASMPPATRRLVGNWERHGKPPAPSAIVGAGLALRTLVSMVTHAISLITRKPAPISFFKTKEEAMVWLIKQRRPAAGS